MDFNVVRAVQVNANADSTFTISLSSDGVSGSEFANPEWSQKLTVKLKAPPYIWGANLFGYLWYSKSESGPFTKDGVTLEAGDSVYTRFEVGTDIRINEADDASARPALYWKRPPTDKADPTRTECRPDSAQYDIIGADDGLEERRLPRSPRTTVEGRAFGETTILCRYDVTQADLDASPWVLGLYMNGWQVVSDYSGKALQPRGLYGWALPKMALEYKDLTVSETAMSIEQGDSAVFTVRLPSDATRRDTINASEFPSNAPGHVTGGSYGPLNDVNLGVGETATYTVHVDSGAAVGATFTVNVYRLNKDPKPTDYTYRRHEITVTVTAATDPPAPPSAGYSSNSTVRSDRWHDRGNLERDVAVDRLSRCEVRSRQERPERLDVGVQPNSRPTLGAEGVGQRRRVPADQPGRRRRLILSG